MRGVVLVSTTDGHWNEMTLGLPLAAAALFQRTAPRVFALLGRVPARGELIRHPAGLEFEVLDADPRCIKKLRIHRPRPKDGSTPAKG